MHLFQIIKPLGRIVGSGMFKCIPKEDALLIPDINVSELFIIVFFVVFIYR